MKTFKEKYEKAKTLGDMEAVAKEIPTKELMKIKGALEEYNELIGKSTAKDVCLLQDVDYELSKRKPTNYTEIEKLRAVVKWASYENEDRFDNKTIPQIIAMFEKEDGVVE